MNIGITGASGFIGYHLLNKLIELGYNVKIFRRKSSRPLKIEDTEKIKFVYGDYLNPESLRDFVAELDYLIHCGGVIKALHKEDFIQGNFISTRNLVDAVNRYNKSLKRFIFLSSQSAQGPSKGKDNLRREDDPPEPVSWYGKSKLMAENYIINHIEVPYTIFRPSSVYGEGDKETARFFKYAKVGVFPFPAGEKHINLIYVKDLVNIIIKSLEFEVAQNQIYFVSDGINYSLSEIAEFLKTLLKKKYFITLKIPLMLMIPVFSVSEFFSKLIKKPSMLNMDKLRELKEKYWLGSTEKIENELGFKAQFNVFRGFPVVYKWYKENQWF